MPIFCTCTQVKLIQKSKEIIAKVKKVEGRRISWLPGYWQYCFLTWTQVTRVLLSFALLCLTDAAFFTNWMKGRPSSSKKLWLASPQWSGTEPTISLEVCLSCIIYRFQTLFWMYQYMQKINTLPPPHLNLAGRKGVHRLPQVHKPQIYGVKLCEIKEKENL